MKIQYIHSNQLRNAEHFQFMTEAKDIFTEFRVLLPEGELFDEFGANLSVEDEVFKKIIKSAQTENIGLADKQRDATFSGLSATVKAAVKHYDEQISRAAKRLKIVFDAFGNLVRKPMNEATSGVYNLLQELNGNFASDVAALGLQAWVQRLEADNETFTELSRLRNSEMAEISTLSLKDCRSETDRLYYEIVRLINALVIIHGEELYYEMLRKFNVVVEKYMNTIAQRRGRSAAKRKRKNEAKIEAKLKEIKQQEISETKTAELVQSEISTEEKAPVQTDDVEKKGNEKYFVDTNLPVP